MIESYTTIDRKLKQEICWKFRKNRNFDSLLKEYPALSHNTIYSILYTICRYQSYDKLYQANIKDNIIMIGSDSHVDSIFERISYIDKSIDYAYSKGCRTILHGGDIIEGRTEYCKSSDYIEQAIKFNKVYPVIDDVKTYGIFGNHDYNSINRCPRTKDMLTVRDDIEVLDYKKAFINWDGLVISLQHNIKNYAINHPPVTKLDNYLSFIGHSHFYGIIDTKDSGERIHIPALCDDPVTKSSYNRCKEKYRSFNMKPGFLIAEKFDDAVVVTYYSFTNNEIVREDEYVKTLKKTIK